MKQKLKKDTVLKEFWRDNERFADLFNGVLFGGHKIVCANTLQEIDTDVSGIIHMKETFENVQRTRDVIKTASFDAEFVLIGLENQQHIHYAMPLRNMIYDAMTYLKEYRLFSHNSENFKTADEFLSKMKKDDKLHPVITLTIYYGEQPWDGPLSLKDMMVHMPESMACILGNYGINLFEIRQSGNYIFHNKDVCAAFDFTKAVYAGHLDTALKKYSQISLNEDVWRFIGTVTDLDEIIMKSYMKEGVNMCEAVDQWIKEKTEQAKAEGVEHGIKRGLNLGRQEGQQIIITNMIKNGLPLESIAQMTGISIESIAQIARLKKS